MQRGYAPEVEGRLPWEQRSRRDQCCLTCLRKAHRGGNIWTGKRKQKAVKGTGTVVTKGDVKLGCHLWTTKRSIYLCFCNIANNHQVILKQLKMIINIISLTALTILLLFLLLHLFCLCRLMPQKKKKIPFLLFMLFKRRADENANIPQGTDLGTCHVYVQKSPLCNTHSCFIIMPRWITGEFYTIKLLYFIALYNKIWKMLWLSKLNPQPYLAMTIPVQSHFTS